MNKNRLFALSLMVYLATSCLPAQAFEGPLRVRNQFPLFMHIDAPELESARATDGFSASFSYSSVFMAKNSAAWDVLIDLEMATLDLQYRKIVAEGLELGLRVPLVNFNSGFMDSFVNDFHRTFGFGNYGRDFRPLNEFAYEVRHNGLLTIKGKAGGIGLGDIRLSAKKMLLSADPAVSVVAGVELPTGDARSGYGNGSVDADLAVMVDKRLGDKMMSYFNAGVIFPGDLKAEETVNLRQSFYAGAGLEYLASPEFGLLLQTVFQTSPFPKTGIGNIDRTGVVLVFGGRYTKAKDSIEFSMTEDPNTAGAPDFTLNVSYTRRF
ncbi:MAG: DUF3187 family protein [Nitrospiraceae bacterium]|nr:DUF3187 family protein [Nitrospiraceae bacterium]